MTDSEKSLQAKENAAKSETAREKVAELEKVLTPFIEEAEKNGFTIYTAFESPFEEGGQGVRGKPVIKAPQSFEPFSYRERKRFIERPDESVYLDVAGLSVLIEKSMDSKKLPFVEKLQQLYTSPHLDNLSYLSFVPGEGTASWFVGQHDLNTLTLLIRNGVSTYFDPADTRLLNSLEECAEIFQQVLDGKDLAKENLSELPPIQALLSFVINVKNQQKTEVQKDAAQKISDFFPHILFDFQHLNHEEKTVREWMQTTPYNMLAKELALEKRKALPTGEAISISSQEAPQQFRLSVLDVNPQEVERLDLPEIVAMLTGQTREKGENILPYLQRVSSNTILLENNGVEFTAPLVFTTDPSLQLGGQIQIGEAEEKRVLVTRASVWIDIDFETMERWITNTPKTPQ